MSNIYSSDGDVALAVLEEEHVQLLARWINDPEIRRFLNAYQPYTEAEELEWVKGLSKRKDSDAVFLVLVDTKPAGVVGIHSIDLRNRTATLGAYLGDKSLWSKGYGTKAGKLVIEYAFKTLNLRKLNTSVFSFNGRSLACTLKCGHVEEGRLKDQRYVDGAYHDEILLAVFREDWMKANEKWLADRATIK